MPASGFCATTVAGYRGDCSRGAMGSVDLAPGAWHDANSVRQACVRACRECARCRVVSWSLRHRDCSWFHTCSLDALRNDVTGFITQQVRNQSATRKLHRHVSRAFAPLNVLRTLDEAEVIYPSQEGQDSCLIEHVFKWRTQGYYVDLAANDPKFLSNTYALDRLYNWSGLCIEPQSRYMEGYAQSRTCTLAQALVGDGNEVTFVEKLDGYRNFGESRVLQPGDRCAFTGRTGRPSRKMAPLCIRLIGLCAPPGSLGPPPGSRAKRMRTIPLRQLFSAARVPARIDYMSLEYAAPPAPCPAARLRG
eukprot:6557378-Prymnesium_polylepis.1